MVPMFGTKSVTFWYPRLRQSRTLGVFGVGQSSSWSVILRGRCLYSMVVMHTYLLGHMAWENRSQCLDKCTGVDRTRVGGHETRPKPNVDYYLVNYYYYYYYYYY